VQVFDQKKFKKKDQGFLGVINIRIGDVIELTADADGKFSPLLIHCCSDTRSRSAYQQIKCSRETLRSQAITWWFTESLS
jgi:protein tyrosine phosphatase (PTP) superfamily phosphohydrolase (DUF442 family)